MCPCLLITKKWLHFLTNRCIRDPYVQWCERLSRSANCRLGGLLDYRFGVLFRLSVYVSYFRFLSCGGLVALLQNLALALGLCGFANVPAIAWAKSLFLFVLLSLFWQSNFQILASRLYWLLFSVLLSSCQNLFPFL